MGFIIIQVGIGGCEIWRLVKHKIDNLVEIVILIKMRSDKQTLDMLYRLYN